MLATLGLERKEIVEEQIMSNQDIVSLGDKTVIVYWWIAYYSVETWSFFLEGKLQALLKSHHFPTNVGKLSVQNPIQDPTSYLIALIFPK